MAHNGLQREDATVDEDETPTKQPRSSAEMPGDLRDEPGSSAAAAAGGAAPDRRASNSTARLRSDSIKKTRPRRCSRRCSRGLRVSAGEGTVPCRHESNSVKL
ncbi:unnamed protein product [Pleuronectes platessa]|uniref:Uncharacterized protein n=1 Tax=Pleuronectes platessa TaxID=8262 RepID=A0A9N7ZC27_PLEPL|nr:unnamed protein product [Pleuronectes platessa]